MSATILVTTREFTDVDFSFDKHPATSNILVKKNSNAVKQSVLNLMRLRSGDVPFHPEMKSPVYDYMFENATSVAKIVMADEVKKYLTIYEPRFDIDEVNIGFPTPNTIDCKITGKIVNVSAPVTISVLVERLR